MQEISLKTRIVRAISLVLLTAVIVGGAIFAWPSYLRGQRFKEEVADLDRQIAEKKAEIADLKDKQRRFKTDPDFVESIARQNRRVYPGELVFVFGKDGKDAKDGTKKK